MVELKYSNPKIVPYYATCQYWYAKIQPGGVWDYKVQSPYKPYNKYFCMTYGINDSKKNYHRTSEFMGNYNYGFTGRVLFNLTTLKLGSNYAASGNPFIPDTATGTCTVAPCSKSFCVMTTRPFWLDTVSASLPDSMERITGLS